MTNQLQVSEAPLEVELKFDDLSKEEQALVNQTKSEIKIDSTTDIMQYGVGVQRKLSEFSDSVLENVKSKDSGEVGEMMTDLMLELKKLDVDSLSEHSFLDKIPFLSKLTNKAQRFLAQYDSLAVQVEKIVGDLETAQDNMMRDILLLDKLYGKNKEYVNGLDILIIAGKIRIEELRNNDLDKLKEEADKTNDPVDAQNFSDMESKIENFEKKIHDLILSRMVAIQTAPQIRIVQKNDELLATKIQSSILNTIPLWKKQMVLAISLVRQEKALKAQRTVTETTNQLLLKNSDMLKQNSLGVAKEMEKGIVALDTLKKVHSDLITTIDETIKIQEQGRKDRATAESEVKQLEQQLKDKLTKKVK